MGVPLLTKFQRTALQGQSLLEVRHHSELLETAVEGIHVVVQ